MFIRKDTKTHFQFRIRNLEWEASNFVVDIDKDKDDIVIRTLNKKYFKRFKISDLQRKNLLLEPEKLKVDFVTQTLVISYEKPEIILKEQQNVLLEIQKIKQDIEKNPEKKYDSDCKNQ